MKIQAIYKAGNDFKEFCYNLRHAYENEDNFESLKISVEERQSEIERYNESKKIYLMDDLYIAILDEESPEFHFHKEDLVLFSNSLEIDKNCLVLCQYKNEYLLGKYVEDDANESIYTVMPLSGKYPLLKSDWNVDLKVFGIVLTYHHYNENFNYPVKELKPKIEMSELDLVAI